MALGWAKKGCPVSRSWRETTMSWWVWLPPHRAGGHKGPKAAENQDTGDPRP